MLNELRSIINYRNLSYYLLLPILRDETLISNLFKLVKNTYIYHYGELGLYLQIHNENKESASNLIWALNKTVGCSILKSGDKFVFVKVELRGEILRDFCACVQGNYSLIRKSSLGSIRKVAMKEGMVAHTLIEAILLKNTKWIRMFIESTGKTNIKQKLSYCLVDHVNEEASNSVTYKLINKTWQNIK